MKMFKNLTELAKIVVAATWLVNAGTAFAGFTNVSISATDPLAREPYEYQDGMGNTVLNTNYGEFTIYWYGSDSTPVTVDIAFSGAAVISGAGPQPDYYVEYPDGALVLDSTNSSKRIRIVPFGDTFCEPTEDVICTVVPNPSYSIINSQAVVYIKNGPISFTITNSPVVNEGEPLIFAISQDCNAVNPTNIPVLPPDPDDGPGAEAVNVAYHIKTHTPPLSGPWATMTLDYTAPSGSSMDTNGVVNGFAYFNGGPTAYVTNVTLADCLTEGSEKLVLSLANRYEEYLGEYGQFSIGTILDSSRSLSVLITNPENGAAFTNNADVAIEAFTDGCESISNVKFYQGSTLLGSDNTAPYSFTWNSVSSGNYTLTAVATTVSSLTVTSPPVLIHVGQFCDQAPRLRNFRITTNTFTFTSTGSSNTAWSVYMSTNLASWTLSGTITNNSGGSNTVADASITGVPYRFYKLSNSNCCSQVVGFARIDVGAGTATNNPGTNALLANQFDVPSGNTLDGLFNVNGTGAMIDGTPLPDGSIVSKWDAASQTYLNYTWNDASGWRDESDNPAGTVTLNPGEGAFLTTGSPLTVTFVGTVRSGNLTTPLTQTGKYYLISAQLPKAGGLQSELNFTPHTGDQTLVWTGVGYSGTTYINGTWVGGQPMINVGQAFFWRSGTTNNWQISFSPCQ